MGGSNTRDGVEGFSLPDGSISCQNGGSLGRARNDRYDFQIAAFHGLNLRNTAKSFDW